ncbi:MAG: TonB-dependent receptor [Bryobacteraceae bacterium]
MKRISILILAVALTTPSFFAAIFGTVRGVVHDPQHRPVSETQVTLKARASTYSRTLKTGPDGTFDFSVVPIGEYTVSVAHDGFANEEQPLVVVSGDIPVLHFQLSLAARSESVEVTATPDAVNPQSFTPTTLVSREDIARTPGADRSNSLAMITSFVPGAYLSHDQLHIRGGHQISWLVDGVPVPNTNIASNVGPQFDPKDIDYLEAERGSYSAEYGDRTYGVFNVVPRTGFERDNEAEVVVGYGNFNQTNDAISFGGHNEKLAYYGSLNGNHTDLGLQTPTPDIIHDQGSGFGGFGSLIYNADPNNQLRLVTSLRRDDYEIPNSAEDQLADVRDQDQERDAILNFSWIHTFRPGLMLTTSPFYHFNQAEYLGGPNDPELSTQDKQTSIYGGAQISLSAVSDRNSLRAGVYGFGQRDRRVFGLTATDGSGLSLLDRITPTGNMEAVFLEDQFKATSWLTLNGGVRLTHFGSSISENAADPRIGAAVRVPRINWVFRGFYGRYYQAPPLSTVAGPLLQYVLDQQLGFLPLRGERNEENQFGVTIPLFGWTIDGDHFHTHTRNFFDHNNIGNSNIFLPLTIAAARVDGWEVTLRSPMLFRKGQVHVAYSNQRAEGAGAITGGLTDFSPPEGYFLLDHDQQNTLSVGGYSNLPWRAWISGNLYYGSGFPDDDSGERLPAHTTFDFAIGKNLRENLSVSVQGVNVANRHGLLDNSLTFGGTHYLNPREIYGEIRYRFHY